jgi:adenine phosphoribosyltransferase
MQELRDLVSEIPDFPKPGILFRDINPLLRERFGATIGAIEALFSDEEWAQVEAVAGIESRGFILASALAERRGKGFVPIRKKGKLPGPTIAQDYKLEYGEAVMEIHDDALEAGEKVLIVDDLLATGGTCEAGIRLIERLGAEVVGCAFVIDLPELGGRARLEALGMEVHALCAFEGK